MELIAKIFENQSSLSSLFQIGLDILILGLLAGVLIFRRPGISKKSREIFDSFGRIIEETNAISKEFETNLQRRKDLLQNITVKLDQRILEAQSLCSRLEALIQTNNEKAATAALFSGNTGSQVTDQQRVLFLAKKGLSAAEIAKNLKRPVGEIELILNLQKIAQ